jgi:hypothetical protein
MPWRSDLRILQRLKFFEEKKPGLSRAFFLRDRSVFGVGAYPGKAGPLFRDMLQLIEAAGILVTRGDSTRVKYVLET